MNTQTTLSTLRTPEPKTLPAEVSLSTTSGFETLQRIANLFSQSSIVPKDFAGNLSNCFIAVDMALRMRANPLCIMQNLYIVHGKPAWSAQFLIATLNQCGRFSALRYAFQGEVGKDNWGCKAIAVELSTGEKLEGPLVTIDLAKKEGWVNKNGSKWQTMPELMLRYRAAAWFVRIYAPEIAMGLSTAEEIHDTIDLQQTPNGIFETSITEMRQNTDAPAIPDSPEISAKAPPKPKKTNQSKQPDPEPDPIDATPTSSDEPTEPISPTNPTEPTTPETLNQTIPSCQTPSAKIIMSCSDLGKDVALTVCENECPKRDECVGYQDMLL